MYLAIVLVLLLLSLYALSEAILMFYIKKKGTNGYFTVDKVEHTIVFGRGKYAKKDGHVNCDYILRIHYANLKGKVIKTRATVSARMKVKNGHYLPFFNEKDQIKMKSCSLSPRLVYVDIPQIADKQGKVFTIVMWSFSTLLLLALFFYLLVA